MLKKHYFFALEQSSKIVALGNTKQVKHTCPACNSTKKYVRYVNTLTREYLPYEYGKCDRADNCGYHNSPYKDAAFMLQWRNRRYPKHPPQWMHPTTHTTKPPITQQATPTITANDQLACIDLTAFSELLHPANYKYNQFLQNLAHNVPYPFNTSDIEAVFSMYLLGTVPPNYDRAGGVSFPFIDLTGRICAVQVRNYNSANRGIATDYWHAILKRHYTATRQAVPEWLTQYEQAPKMRCLFGEHLLQQYSSAPVCLVEAPKTAVIATLYYGMPDFSNTSAPIWLATGGKSNFTIDRLKVLQGRSVTVYPDLSKDGITHKEWALKAAKFNKQINGLALHITDYLEHTATQDEREAGLDLADYLINENWQDYRENTPEIEPESFTVNIEPVTQPPHSCLIGINEFIAASAEFAFKHFTYRAESREYIYTIMRNNGIASEYTESVLAYMLRYKILKPTLSKVSDPECKYYLNPLYHRAQVNLMQAG
jgi:hypothetical protein